MFMIEYVEHRVVILDTAIVGGTIVTPNRTIEADIGIEDGRIVSVDEAGSIDNASNIVDADGKYVLPGVVDPHTHIDGYYSIDTYPTATAAAALGGVTTLINFAWQAWEKEGPDSMSIWDEDGTLLEAVRRQKQKGSESLIDFGLHGGITREDTAVFDELDAVMAEGVTSFKLFTAYEQGLSNGFIHRVFGELAERDAIAVVHTEDQSTIDARIAELKAAKKTDPRWYPESRPPVVEAMTADSILRLATDRGVQYYGFHTSGGSVADVIAQHQTDGTQVRGETCPHYLALTKAAYKEQGTLPIIAPPLRSDEERERLISHLKQGTLNTISTDHVAFDREKKEVEHWWDSAFGANSLQYSLPIVHDVLVTERGMSYPALVRLMCTNPAKTFGFTEKGTLEVGTDADIVVFDPDKQQTITADESESKANFSIYENRTVTGAVETVLVRGTVVASDGDIVADPGHGEFLSREPTEWEPLANGG